MKRASGYVLWGAALFVYLSFVTIPSARAYVDPGTGSYFFQIAIGALLAAGVAVKMFWKRIWGFVTRHASRGGATKEE